MKLLTHIILIINKFQFIKEEFEDVCLNDSTKNPLIINGKSNFTSNYNLRIYSSVYYCLDQLNN